MMSHVTSATSYGFDGKLIDVECDLTKGLPALQIVGLGDKAITEARERVKSAIVNSNLDYPSKRLTINLAPANLPKDGAHFDLSIALAVLIASGQLPQKPLKSTLCVGELSLSGNLRPIRGIISLVEIAKQNNFKTVILPQANAAQASIVKGIQIISAANLADVYLHLLGEKLLKSTGETKIPAHSKPLIDIADIKGQSQAKRALVIAAAGRHNILLDGPPGAGKTMLAKALAGLLPAPSYREQIEITKLHSLNGENIDGVINTRPFRSPHHTASTISLVGGGAKPIPGEISLAHNGVLFMDEIPEYPRASLEALRQPLEDGQINVSRAAMRITYPANIMLVATKNPCPCGFYGDPTRECDCSQTQILNYQKRISGPLLDRIDMRVAVARVSESQLLDESRQKPQSNKLQQQITAARQLQRQRQAADNARLPSKSIARLTKLSQQAKELLNQASTKLQLSARSYFKLIKVARTIADLESSVVIEAKHMAEALQYR